MNDPRIVEFANHMTKVLKANNEAIKSLTTERESLLRVARAAEEFVETIIENGIMNNYPWSGKAIIKALKEVKHLLV